MEPKTILSLFDYSGVWAAPFVDAGHNVIQLDEKLDPGLADVAKFDCTYFFETLGIDWVDAIMAAPPCTHFTGAGAQYWKEKDEDGRTAEAVNLVNQVLRCVEFWKPDWWVLENPVGRLPSLVPALGKARMTFHPADFSGWVKLTEAEKATIAILRTKREELMTAEDIALIKKANLYTKRTQLWGDFYLPVAIPRLPIRVCKQGSWLQKLGGASEATKSARSETPEGFALAFYAENEWTPDRLAAYDAKREMEEA